MTEGQLFVPVSTGPFRAYESGVKTVEVRQYGGRWTLGNVRRGQPALIRRGYSTPDELRGTVVKVVAASSWAELPDWARLGSDVDDPYESLDRIHFTHLETGKQFADKRDLGHILAERAAKGEDE